MSHRISAFSASPYLPLSFSDCLSLAYPHVREESALSPRTLVSVTGISSKERRVAKKGSDTARKHGERDIVVSKYNAGRRTSSLVIVVARHRRRSSLVIVARRRRRRCHCRRHWYRRAPLPLPPPLPPLPPPLPPLSPRLYIDKVMPASRDAVASACVEVRDENGAIWNAAGAATASRLASTRVHSPLFLSHFA